MNATMCPRCGGHLDRCECAELRREGMLMAADDLRAYSDDLRSAGLNGGQAMPGPVICKDRARQFEEAASRIRALANGAP
jgi:hypothetical protein